MSVSSAFKNPKLLISKFFHSLINQIEIFTEEQLAFYESNSSISIKDYEKNDDNRKIEEISVADTSSGMESKELTKYVDSIIDTDSIEDYFDYDGKTKLWNIKIPSFDIEKNLSKNTQPKTMKV